MGNAALVTGGAKRIGRAIARGLAGAGFDIALHYNTSGDQAEATAGEIESMGRRCETFPRDLSDSTGASRLIVEVFETFPECNVLVNNASLFGPGDLADTDAAMLDAQFDVNFKSPLLLSKDFAARCQGGSIVNILDSRVSQTVTDHFAYTLSKKALAEFTKLAAVALATAVRVNAVCPGLVLPADEIEALAFEKLAARVPLKRAGEVDDVVRAVLFLVENRYVTGQPLFVDGGEGLVR